MPTYIKDIDYSIHMITSVTHQLKVVEEPDIPNSGSKLTVSIIRNNSSNVSTGGIEYLTLKINGETVFDGRSVTPKPTAYGSDEVFIRTYTVPQTAGTNNFTVSVTYKCDNIDQIGNTWVGNLTPDFYYTIGTATITGTLTPIDQSPPLISGLTVKADRYGINASASFTALHTSYNLTSIVFKLSGLTSSQAYGRYAKATQADKSNYSRTTDGKYELKLSKHKDLTNSISINFDLDDRFDNERPLDSGGMYPWELTVTAYNGKSTTISGILKVPQKVTGVTCESQLDLVPGQTAELEYTVSPGNAEYPAVDFISGDESVATVDTNGIITAIGEGMCQITVITRDGGSPDAVSGYTAECIVSVLNTEMFPKLSEIRYLSTREISKFSFACTFLREKLLEKGIAVDNFVLVNCKGKNHPVKEIRNVLDAVKSNCIILNNAVKNIYPSVSLSDSAEMLKENISVNWYLAVNEWIRFLNELNKQIEKEV